MSQRFPLGRTAEALDVSPETIKSWLHRGLMIGHDVEDAPAPAPAIDGGGGRGMRRSFSINAIMQMAVANEIITRLKVRDSKFAFDAALRFAHTGHGVAGYSGEVLDYRQMRLPGLPFHYSLGRTVLIIGDSGAEVVPESELESPFNHGEIIVVMVDVSVIFDRVCARLMQMTGDKGWHPNAILDAAYPVASGEF